MSSTHHSNIILAFNKFKTYAHALTHGNYITSHKKGFTMTGLIKIIDSYASSIMELKSNSR